MPELETENYIRLVLLIIDIGSSLLRDILLQEIRNGEKSLAEVLEDKRVYIEDKLHSRVLTEKQYNQLFPIEDEIRDIGSWDISLLTFVILSVFEDSFQPEVCIAIENIREHRNFVAHSASTTVDYLAYIDRESQVRNILKVLVLQLDSRNRDEYYKRIIQCSTNVFSQAGMEHLLKDLCKKEDILNQFNSLQEAHYKALEKSLLSKVKEIVENHNTSVKDIPSVCLVLEIEGGDHATKFDAHKLLLKLFTAAKQKAPNPCRYDDIYRIASDLLDELSKNGTKVEDVSTKCLIFSLRCSSVKSLLDLLSMIQNQDNFIANSIRKIVKVIIGEKSNFRLFTSRSSLVSLLSFLDDVQQVKMRVKVPHHEVFTSLYDVTFSEKMDSSLKRLSNSLSTAVGRTLSLRASIEQTEKTPTVEDTMGTSDVWDAAVWLDAHGIKYDELDSLEEMLALVKLKKDKNKETGSNKVKEIHLMVNRAIQRSSNAMKNLSDLYADTERWFMKEDIDPDMDRLLTSLYGDFRRTLADHRKLLDEDRHIIIAGASSSGKSSLLNLLLESDVFPDSLLHERSGICCLHNSDRKRMEAVDRNGKRNYVDIANGIDLREQLKYSEANGKRVDIYWPLLKIQGHVTFVDTPGIEDNEEVAHFILEYASKAAAFIFVINSSSVWSHWKKFLQYLCHLDSTRNVSNKFRSNMIFVCNKWDMVTAVNQEEEVWKEIIAKLRAGFPNLREENVVKMSVTKALRFRRVGLGMTKDYQDLLEVVTTVIQSNDKAILLSYTKWLETFLHVTQNLTATVIENYNTVESAMKTLLNKSEQFKEKLVSEIECHCEDISQELQSFLQSRKVTERLQRWYDDDMPMVIEEDMEVTYVNVMVEIFIRIINEIIAWENQFGLTFKADQTIVHMIQEEMSTLEKECKVVYQRYPNPVDFRGMKSGQMGVNAFRNISTSNGRLFKALINGVSQLLVNERMRISFIGIKVQALKTVQYAQQLTRKIVQFLFKDDRLCKYMLLECTNVHELYLQRFPNRITTDTIFYMKSSAFDLVKLSKALGLFNDTLLCDEDIYIEPERFDYICEFEPRYNREVFIVAWTKRMGVKAIAHKTTGPGVVYTAEKLRAIQHKNVLELIGISWQPGYSQRVLVFEYCPESLQTMVYTDKALQCSQFQSIEERWSAFQFFTDMAVGVCDGLGYLHDNGQISGNLQLTTVLVKEGVPKVFVVCRSDNDGNHDIKCLGALLVDLWHGGSLKKVPNNSKAHPSVWTTAQDKMADDTTMPNKIKDLLKLYLHAEPAKCLNASGLRSELVCIHNRLNVE